MRADNIGAGCVTLRLVISADTKWEVPPVNMREPVSPSPGNLIGGRWQPAATGETLTMVCPSDGRVFAEIADSTEQDVGAAIGAARKAADGGAWSRLTALDRGRLLVRLGELVAANAGPLAELEARDTGKPLRQARADIVATARYFEFYGSAADKVHGEVIPFLDGYQVQVVREPFGVTGHIIPWNYPAQMFGRSVAPALAMGNAAVLKPAEEACLSVLMIARLAQEAGFPDGALNVVTGRGERAGAALSAHRGVDFLSFTGSPEVGVLIQTAAARNHIGCTLELGGKSPNLVFADADLDTCIPTLVNAIVQNAGQTCSAGSRALIEASIFDEVMARLSAGFAKLVAGRWDDEQADLGALISAVQRDRVRAFADRAGFKPAAKGKVRTDSEDGFYVAPQLFGPVPADHELALEEVFGPVLACQPFREEDDAVRIANGTEYGLVAGVWTRDAGRLMRVGKRLRCGQVFLNGYGAGGGVELPFGGVRKSGHGREKGFAALHEFSQTKTLVHHHG
jgi:aldehyde dehydrogenase (NAD+)